MAQETTVAVKINAQTGGTESVKSLKAQIREATNEAVLLAQKFGEFSPEATKAAQRVAELKDQMGDFQERVAALNPDKFQAIATLTQGFARGFQAAQGAMALFGAESEDIQKTLVKVQGAMAFAEGVQGVIALTNQFKALGQVAVQALNNIAKGLGRTGVGLLVVALGIAITELVANWDKLKAMISGTNKIQESLNKSLSAYNEGAKEASLKTMEVGMAFDNAKKGVISKEEALQIYNEQLGDVLGSQTDLNAAEQVFIQNADVYVEAAAKRKQIDALLTQAAEIESKARMDAQQAEIDFNKDKYATEYDRYLMQREQRFLKAKATEEAAAAKSAAKQVGSELAELTKGTKVKFNVSLSGAKTTNAAIESEQKRHEAELKRIRDAANAELYKSQQILQNALYRELLAKTHDEYEKQVIEFDQRQLQEQEEIVARRQEIQDKADAENRKLTIEEQNAIKQIGIEFNRIVEIQTIERNNFITDLEKKKNEDLKKIREEADKERKAIQDKEISDTFAATDKVFEAKKNQLTLQGAAQSEFDNLEIQRLEAQLQNAKDYGELTKDETLRIEAELATKRKEIRDKDIAKQEAAEQRRYRAITEGLTQANDVFQAFAQRRLSVMDEQFAKEKMALDNSLKLKQITEADYEVRSLDMQKKFDAERNATAKRAFDINKKVSLALAIMQTAQAVTAALTAGGNPIKLATGAQFVEAGIAAAVGAANIAKILATRFEGAGSSGYSVGGGGGGGGMQPPSTTPITGGTLPDTEAGQFAGMGKVYVLEGDITKTQTRVRSVRNLSVV